jgi:hypothetical protein
MSLKLLETRCDPQVTALQSGHARVRHELRDRRVRANEAQIAQYLEGHWQEDFLFLLKQEQ